MNVEKGVRDDDVENTEMVLAFPLLGEREEESNNLERFENERIPEQSLFAFLPVRSFGFRFIVQGDF